jgi:hypothetical protein
MRLLVESSMAFLVGALAVPSAAGQSIADYSHAQRALLEAGMAQVAARVAALGASTVASAASAAAAPAQVEAMRAVDPPDALILVDGVFDSNTRRLVELSVDGHPYLLSPGQPVPGTPWRVATVSIDRVVLARSGADAALSHVARGATTRTYTLPALR